MKCYVIVVKITFLSYFGPIANSDTTHFTLRAEITYLVFYVEPTNLLQVDSRPIPRLKR